MNDIERRMMDLVRSRIQAGKPLDREFLDSPERQALLKELRMSKIPVPDIDGPTVQLCWKQSPAMVRCDRAQGHLWLHSWEYVAPSAVGAPPPAPSGLVQQLQRLQRYRWCNGAPWFERLEASETAAEHAEYGGLVVKLSAVQRVIHEALHQPAAQGLIPALRAKVELWRRQGHYDDCGNTHPAYCLAKRQDADELAALLAAAERPTTKEKHEPL